MYNIHTMNIPSWLCDKAMREASKKSAKSKKQGHRLTTLLSWFPASDTVLAKIAFQGAHAVHIPNQKIHIQMKQLDFM